MSQTLNKLTEAAGNLLDDVFAFISAPRCPACDDLLDDPRLILCHKCNDALNYPGEGPICMVCRSPEGIACGCSDRHRIPVPRLYYWAPYKDSVRSLIQQFKFDYQLRLGEYLTSQTIERLRERLSQHQFDIIIPVPMIKRDMRKRTFNQTELMANIISQKLTIPADYELLKKIKPTRLQADLGRDERWRNVRGVFAVVDDSRIIGKNIMLVDDIVTTGATCLEASKALYSAKAKSIVVVSLASSHHNEL
jgi:competence protein ComFC